MCRVLASGWIATVLFLTAIATVLPPVNHPAVAETTAPAAKNSGLEELSIERGDGAEPLKFRIEVARSARQKALGLMFRRELAPLRGMLFPYEGEQPVSMWMKNTYIPLDMLFIKSDGTIHRIEAMTEPFSERIIESGAAVAAVLEIAGGEARRLKISPGDRVRHAHFQR